MLYREITVSVLSKPPITLSREEMGKVIEEKKTIAKLNGGSVEELISEAEALYNNGIRFLEIAYSADSAVSDEETAQKIEKLADHFKDRLYIGAGSVLTEEQVLLTKAAGGAFVISANTNEKVIRQSYRCGLVSVAGGLTPTEVNDAYSYGADFVKLFPLQGAETDYIKAVKEALPHIRLLASCKADGSGISDYLDAGASCVEINADMILK